MSLWIASPPHRGTGRPPAGVEIGISAVGVARAPGVYGGMHAIIITTDFGVRR